MLRSVLAACFLLPSLAQAQFPLSQPVTGDTLYDGPENTWPLASYPWDDGALFIQYGAGGPEAMHITDDGLIAYTHSLGAPWSYTNGTVLSSQGILLTGYTLHEHAAFGRMNGTADGLAWSDTLGSLGMRYNGIVELANGDLFTMGTWEQSGTDQWPLARRSTAAGAPLWYFDPPSLEPRITTFFHGRELSDGSLLLAGMNGPPLPNMMKVFCARLTADGGYMTGGDLGTGGFQLGRKVLPHPDGGSVIWGRQDSPVNLFVARVNDDCQAVWTHYIGGLRFGDALYDPATSSFMVTGQREGVGALVARFGLDGDTVWTHTYGGPGFNGDHIRPDGFGGFLITGTGPGTSPFRPYLLRVDADGLITGTEDLTRTRTAFRLAPNPAGDAWTLLTDASAGVLRWDLRDTMGRSLRTGTLHGGGPHAFTRDGLASGRYILCLTDAEAGLVVLPLVLD